MLLTILKVSYLFCIFLPIVTIENCFNKKLHLLTHTFTRICKSLQLLISTNNQFNDQFKNRTFSPALHHVLCFSFGPSGKIIAYPSYGIFRFYPTLGNTSLPMMNPVWSQSSRGSWSSNLPQQSHYNNL